MTILRVRAPGPRLGPHNKVHVALEHLQQPQDPVDGLAIVRRFGPRIRLWSYGREALCRPGLLDVRGLDNYNDSRYGNAVIKSFRRRETERIWRGRFSTGLPADIQHVARRKLRMINNAQSLADLRVPPGNSLEALKGDRAGQYSIRINDQWRVCFVWDDGDAHSVEIVDYH